ncbi:hypothetical protein [Sinorhizobium medicae]|uniref:hypothetical protein n=1 Tax=Sinorhizobium TaxID=28105 RepID=UPI00299D3EF1|nr:hypothetical protein [Sinorhizobium medicae]MDW9680682.1 hypothetical protein [Sinorhizobium meliloti]MDW9693220.1 hypothetical protein [Sinorhizobium meliloti]MDW9718159.1 hypothetical protein [Sinorhizobium meliloti]MDW9755306.1 hypothetical protein [Sinorhizobium meliloti]MDX0801665.1 hypothetical protein [Sinorhizobium medicae]
MFNRWRNVAVGAICFFGILALIGLALFRPGAFCNANEHCLREWISASSGWAAVAIAAATIWPMYKQLAAQQLQADFQLGDAGPTFDALQDVKQGNRVVVKVTNWNRRPLVFRQFRVRGPFGLEEIGALGDASKQYMKVGTSKNFIEFTPAVVLEGWADRGKAPKYLQFEFDDQTKNMRMASSHWHGIEFILDYEMVGLRRKFSQRIPVHTVSFPVDSLAIDLGGTSIPT